jgi:hypothetical protein
MEETKKMKRNLFLAIAVAAVMLATTVAQAADVTFSGQFRPRFNIDEDHNSITSPSEFFDTRVRLNADAKVNANTSVFLQFQATGTWGSNTDADGTRVSVGGGGDEANDVLNDVGFHQAFLTLKNFGGKAVDAKIGRQEIVIDGHRLFGHTGWTQGAQSSDAIRLTHSAGNHTLNYTYIMANEADSVTTSANSDASAHVIYGQTQGVMGGTLSGIFVAMSDSSNNGGSADTEEWYTIGARQKGKMAGLDYRVEFYHQFGDAGVIGGTCACGITGVVTGTADSVDRDAQMFGVRIGKTFANTKGKPSITLWYDQLSGQDDDDATGGEFGQFNTLYDTGHKFYGFQDFYLANTGANTGFYGLIDFAIKTKISPTAGWTAKADLHMFSTQTDISGSDADTVVAADATLAAAADENLGQELDLTLVHKYDANTKISFGYSHYWTTHTFALVNANAAVGVNNSDGSDWFYAQIDTKF